MPSKTPVIRVEAGIIATVDGYQRNMYIGVGALILILLIVLLIMFLRGRTV